MIGHLISAYCLGRADAKAGRARRPGADNSGSGHAYSQGHYDERQRMREEKRLAQLELFALEAERPTLRTGV